MCSRTGRHLCPTHVNPCHSRLVNRTGSRMAGEAAAQALRLPGIRDHRRTSGHQRNGHPFRAHWRGGRGGAEAPPHHVEGHPLELVAQRATGHLAE